MTNDELKIELYQLLARADDDNLADNFLAEVLRMYGQLKVLDCFADIFTDDQTREHTTKAFQILMQWKMSADGYDPERAGSTIQ